MPGGVPHAKRGPRDRPNLRRPLMTSSATRSEVLVRSVPFIARSHRLKSYPRNQINITMAIWCTPPRNRWSRAFCVVFEKRPPPAGCHAVKSEPRSYRVRTQPVVTVRLPGRDISPPPWPAVTTASTRQEDCAKSRQVRPKARRTRQCRPHQFRCAWYQLLRSTQPGRAPVCTPSSSSTEPFTIV